MERLIGQEVFQLNTISWSAMGHGIQQGGRVAEDDNGHVNSRQTQIVRYVS